MARRRRERLTAEDRALWEKVVRDAAPLGGRPPRPETAPPPPARRAGEAAEGGAPPAEGPPKSTSKAEAGPRAPSAHRTLRPEGKARPPYARAETAPPIDTLDPAHGLDRRTAHRLKRGRRPPEARLDLHGMTAERAHAELGRFLRRSRAQGLRCVLVVTGKGGRRPAEDAPFMPERTGVLRHSAPLWLRTPPLSTLIVGVYSAHRSHGGDGALYVYLKKSR